MIVIKSVIQFVFVERVLDVIFESFLKGIPFIKKVFSMVMDLAAIKCT